MKDVVLVLRQRLEVKIGMRDITDHIDLLHELFSLSFCCGTLLIHFGPYSVEMKDLDAMERMGIPNFRRFNHGCIDDHLEEIRINNMEGDEVQLVQSLLGDAKLLHTVNISFSEAVLRKPTSMRLGLIDRIERLPSISPIAEVHFIR